MKRQTNSRLRLVLLIGSIAALGPFATDMYLPGFPSIAKDLQTNETYVSYTLTSYFIGISLGQLFYGPILDKFGRKKPLLLGLLLFLVSSLVCAISPNVEVLIGGRFVQAIAASVGMVAGNAIIRDQFETKEVAKILSSVLLVMGVAPVIAPTLGSLFVEEFSWRYIFYFLAATSGVIIVSLYAFLKETHGYQEDMEFRLLPIFENYRKAMNNTQFFRYTLGGSMSMSIMFAYVSSISFILISLYKMSKIEFGIVFAVNAAGFIGGSQINRVLINKFQLHQLTRNMAAIQLLVGSVFLVFAYNYNVPLWLFLGYVWVILFLLGFINPNTAAMALEPFDENVGVASALYGSIRMCVAAAVTGLIGVFYDQTLMPLVIFIFGLSLLAFVLLLIAGKRRG